MVGIEPKLENRGGGGMRPLAVVGCLLMLAAAAFLYPFLGGDTTHATIGNLQITITNPQPRVYVATDNSDRTTTWRRANIIGTGINCNTDWDRTENPGAAYTEGDRITIGTGVDVTACFRSYQASYLFFTVSVPAKTTYAGITVRDNVAPVVDSISSHAAVTWGIDDIGQKYDITVFFNEKVIVDKKGGDGPRLKLNSADDRYVYVNPNILNRLRSSISFGVLVEAGDNTLDLGILAWEDNGSTTKDAAGNRVYPNGHNEFSDLNYFSDKHNILIDTERPVITVSSPVNSKVTATVTDNLDPAAIQIRWTAVLAGATCPTTSSSSLWGSYVTTQTEELTLPEGQKICYEASDVGNNKAYAESELGRDITPPTIVVNPSSDYSDPGRQTTVTAQSADTDLDTTSWRSKDISGSATCDAAAVGTSLLPGSIAIHSGHGISITLADEAYNSRKICFAVKDTDDNWAYLASGVITGIDRTAPIITVSSIINNKVSATISGGHTTFEVATIYDGVCSSATSATFTSYAASSDVTLASVIGARICFKAVDSVGNESYVASDPFRDTTPPTITVNPSAAHSTPKRQLTVTARSGSVDVNNNSWRHKSILGSASCNVAGMASGTSSGRSVTLNSEADNNHKVCFAVKDGSNNWAYAASGLITGIDRTAPVITVSPVVDNKVSATVTASASFESQIITDNVCSSATSGSFAAYTAGTELTLPAGSRACFRATDSLTNTRYVASGIGVDTTVEVIVHDITSPTITVNPSAADSTPKRQIRVFASSSSSDVDSSSWQHKLVSSSTGCNSVEMASGTSSGRSVTLNSEADNNHKVCFTIKDTSNNPAYAASGLITGIDRTLPVITVSPVTSDNGVSATVSDNADNSPTFESQLIGNNICDFRTGGTFAGYTAGTVLSLPAGSRACFRATDSAGNISHAASGVGVVIADTPLPAININLVANNQVSATLVGALTNSPVLEVQIITGNVCSSATGGSFSAYTAGTVLSLPAGSRACFRVTDSIGRAAYTPSVAGQGSSSQRPSNTRRSSNTWQSPPRLVVSVLPGETLSASDNYGSGTTMSYMVRSDDTCDDTAEGTFNVYQEGTALVAPADVDNDYYVCFRSVANNDSNNVAYAVSELVVVETEPEPDPAEDEVDTDPSAPTTAPIFDGETDNRPVTEPIVTTSTPDFSSDTGVKPDPTTDADDESEADPDDDQAEDQTDTEPAPVTPSTPGPDGSPGGPPLVLIGLGLLILVLALAVAKRFSERRS